MVSKNTFFVLILWTMFNLKMSTNYATFTVTKWNRRLRHFESVGKIPSYENVRQKIACQARKRETHNFNGERLRLTYFEMNDAVKFYDNNTKITGLFGDIWNLLSKSLNFTLVVHKSVKTTLGIYLENGSYSGILEDARVNQTEIIPRTEVYPKRIPAVEFTSPFWMSGQKIFAHGYWKQDRAWMFTIFPLEVWCIIFSFYITLSLLSVVSQKLPMRHKSRNNRPRTCVDHLFYTFATLVNQGELNQGNVFHHIGNGSRMLTVTICVFSWLILIGYSSNMIYSMAKEIFAAPFKDLESLFTNTDFRIAVLNGSVSDIILSNSQSPEIYYRFKRAQRVTVVSNIDDLYRTVCLNMNKYVLMHGEDAVATRQNPTCTLFPVGTAHSEMPITAGISRSLKNKRALDIGIMRLVELGIIDAIKKRYMYSHEGELSTRKIGSLAIDMDRVCLIFGILGLGMIGSIIICVAENMIFILQNRAFIRRWQ